MKRRQFISTVCLGILLGGVAVGANAQDQMHNMPPDANTTSNNMRDQNAAQPTADQASNNITDREIMSRIRKRIVSDRSLSTYGHNVTVIAENGHVTLRGPVHGAVERKKIERKASYVVGEGNVTDELSIRGEDNP